MNARLLPSLSSREALSLCPSSKQVRGAILDLLMHPYPKKLLVLIPKWTGANMVNESKHILSRSVNPQDFQVVCLLAQAMIRKQKRMRKSWSLPLLKLGCSR